MLQLSAGKDASEGRGLVRFERHCRLFKVSVKLGKAQSAPLYFVTPLI